MSTPPSALSAELFLPTRNGRDDETIAAAILRETARMRQAGSFDTHALCWNPEELELLAMFAVDAKARLSSRSAEDRSDTERLLVERLAGAVCAMIDRGALDARSEAGDALLDYASVTYGDERPIESVRERYLPKRAARTASPRESHE